MKNNLILDGPEMTPEEFYECMKYWGSRNMINNDIPILDGSSVTDEELITNMVRAAEEEKKQK